MIIVIKLKIGGFDLNCECVLKVDYKGYSELCDIFKELVKKYML